MPKRVLVVNDVEVMSRVLENQLRELGFDEIGFAANGSEALNFLDRCRPDLVISDVHMPVLDGFQLCRLMRSPEFRELNHIPVVLLSATYRDHAASRLAREVMAQGFVQWPLEGKELATTVQRALENPDAPAEDLQRVLVAEDDDAIRNSLVTMLRNGGFEVMPVGDGEEAIEAADTFRPHLVLCDYMMPRANGAVVLSWYREHRPETPVIIVTAHGSEKLAVEMMRKGAYDYLAKPLELRVVAPICRSALEKYNVKGISRQFDDMLVRLRRSEQHYRALFENAGDAVFLCDAQGFILELNRRSREMLGGETRSFVGRPLREVLTLADPRGREVFAALTGQEEASVEATIQSRARGEIPVELSGARITVEGEAHWLAVVRDLTDRKWVSAFVRDEHRFLKTLHENTKLIDSDRGLRDFLSRMLQSAMGLLRARAGAILSAPWGAGPGGDADTAFTLRGVPEALVSELAHLLPTRARTLGDNAPYTAMFRKEQLLPMELELGWHTRLEVGLWPKGMVRGHLMLWWGGQDAVPDTDRTLAQAIASHLGLALENAALLARVSSAQDDWQRTFDSVQELVFVMDDAGRIVRANHALLSRLVDPASAAVAPPLLGRDALGLLYGENPPPDTPVALVRTTREPLHAEHELPGIGAGIFSITASPLFAEYGGYRGAAVVLRDVSAERHAQQQRVVSEKMATLGRLAAGITHEINNPAAYVFLNISQLQESLRTISNCIDEYRKTLRGLDAPVAAEMEARETELGVSQAMGDISAILSDSLEGMQRIRSITQDLRFFAHTRDELARPFDLNEVVESAISIARHEVRHRARLTRNAQKLPLCVGDAMRFVQVVVNLLVNAAQAIEEGHIDDNEVRVSTYARGDRIFLEVADTGCGIPPESLPHIFDLFFTTKEPGAGTGLGLSICYEIVKRHGGEIRVESTVGRGSTFIVEMPAGKARASVPAAAPKAAEEPPARVLLIEDEIALRRALARVLTHDLHMAATGREALEILARDQSWDVILCDVLMPDVSGIEVFQRIQSDWPELVPRVLFVTGGVRAELAAVLRKSGRPIMEKPITPQALNEMIAKIRPGPKGAPHG
jgi:PAS domain S-box-containing protein